MACLCVLINLASSVNSFLFLRVRESLVLNRYHSSSLTMLCNFLEFLLVYSMTECLFHSLVLVESMVDTWYLGCFIFSLPSIV